MKCAAVRARWDDETIRRLQKAVRDQVITPEVADAITGRGADLAGARMTGIVRCGLANVDLSCAVFERGGQITVDSSCHDVRFDSAKLNTNVWGQYEDCSFQRTELTGANLVGRFRKCNFTGARLDRALCVGAVFEDVDFSAASMNTAYFGHCRFRNVCFVGIRAPKGVYVYDCTFLDSSLDLIGCPVVATPR